MIKTLHLIKTYWLILTLCTLIAITLLSLWPLPNIPGTDKTHHIIAYMMLMLPMTLGRPNNWLLTSPLLISYSGMIELIQPYVNRYAEWMDLLANTTGVLLGLILAKLCLAFYPELGKTFHSRKNKH